MQILQNILNVFFSSVRRAGWTLGVLALIFFASRPDLLVSLIRSILHAILGVLHELLTGLMVGMEPLFAPLIAIFFVFVGARFIWNKGVRR